MGNEQTKAKDKEQGFNESELADIMSEIESLENEFVDDQPSSVEDLTIKKDEIPDNDFQDVVDTEIKSSQIVEDDAALEEEIAKVQEEMDIADDVPIEGPIIPEEQIIDTIEDAQIEDAQAALNDMNNEEITDDLEVIGETPIAEEAPTIEEVEQATEAIDNVVPFAKEEHTALETTTKTSQDTAMNFTVSGQMNLQLNFTVGEEEIKINVNGEEGFSITMSNGMTFSVPIEKMGSQKYKKAI